MLYIISIISEYDLPVTPFLPGPGGGRLVRGQGQGGRDLDTLGGDQE